MLQNKRNSQKHSQTIKVHFFKIEVLKNLSNSTEHLRWRLLKIMNSNNYWRVWPIFATRQLHQFFYKNSLTILSSASTVVEHFYLLKIATILETRATYFKQEPQFLIDQPGTYLIFMFRCIKSMFFNQSGNQFRLYRVNLESFIFKKHKQISS